VTEKQAMDMAWPSLVGLGMAMETYALMRRQGGLTLSSHVWQVRDQGKPTVRKTLIGVVMMYLSIHFLWGGRQK
jgi:hypothetical protein